VSHNAALSGGIRSNGSGGRDPRSSGARSEEGKVVTKKLKVRSIAYPLIRKYPWLPPLAVILSGLGLLLTAMGNRHSSWELAAITSLFFSSYVWGYATQALTHRLYPPLTDLRRRQYAQAWDLLASSREEAYAAASGQRDEAGLRHSAGNTIRNLVDLVSVNETDDVLEIGCGVGRIGRELAPFCSTWTGADTSSNMLAYASDRLGSSGNVRLVQLHAVGLPEFEASSFDVVYMTNMLMHLDEMDRWYYVQEAYRILRAGGRIFIDNIGLESDAGWSMFANDAQRFRCLERPPYMPRFSTAAELAAYATRAGFEHVQCHHRPPLVILTSVKPRLGKENDSSPAYASDSLPPEPARGAA